MGISEQITRLDYTVVGVYLVAVLGLGFYVSFRKGHSEDLFLAGRSLHWPNVGLSIFGTNVSPAFMVGGFGVAYKLGMVGANYEWMAWAFLFLLAMLFLPHYLNTNISTMPEFMQKRYGKASRVFLSYYAVLTTTWMWIGGTLFAGGLLLSQILGWPIWVSALFLSVVATSFTVAGGLAAVVVTDSFQSILMILASAWMTIIGFMEIGGMRELIGSVPDESFWVLLRPASDADYPWPAMVFGYPVLGLWFWCTDQTIVQRALGARTLKQGQWGCAFAGYLKVLTPLIFFIPGIMCRILHPGLPNEDEAYMTMVVNHLPVGAVGLVIAVLMAALISTVDSGLNSLSTVFTLDVYAKSIRPGSSPRELRNVGRIVTIAAGALGIFIALAFEYANQYLELFGLSQAMIGFFSPPMAAVFLVGVLWPRATRLSGFLTLVVGTIVCLTVGVFYVFVAPTWEHWPHFMMLAFYLFVALVIFQVIVSLLGPEDAEGSGLEPVSLKYLKQTGDRFTWWLWVVLAVIMTGIYLLFDRVFW